MEGTPVLNKQKTTCPLKVALADGRRVMSTHMCDIILPGLPTTLVGHIIPEFSKASLFGKRVLTEAGCTVMFDNLKCVVQYNNKTILIGWKDPTMDLWTLPIVDPAGKTTQVKHHDMQGPLAVPVCASAHACKSGGKAATSLEKTPPLNQVSLFTHTVCTKANSMKFAHQSLCSPRISTLLKAIRRGFLKGCPNLTAKGVTRYLNPSPATAKGHMKRPHQGICSTMPRPPRLPMPTQPLSRSHDSTSEYMYAPLVNDDTLDNRPNYIADKDNSTDSNIFCFGAFADKRSGIIYNDLTGTFLYMSLQGNIGFLVVYHYESNAILALPIPSLNNNTIFAAYITQFEFLESKGHKIKLNVMDNQCTRLIEKILTEKDCDLMLVEPHNHHMNAAERAIQTFKDHFISALATTDSEFPLQLLDRLTPQVENTLNLMRASCTNPNMLAYEAIHGPYDWNRFPLAPLGCKAIIYKSPEAWGSWGTQGTDAW